jgi:hypothetical protein
MIGKENPWVFSNPDSSAYTFKTSSGSTIPSNSGQDTQATIVAAPFINNVTAMFEHDSLIPITCVDFPVQV